MRKRCEGLQLSTCGDSQISRSHSGRDGARLGTQAAETHMKRAAHPQVMWPQWMLMHVDEQSGIWAHDCVVEQ
jgi:hypothetical protein